MPGLAAGPAIFEKINLPSEIFEMHFLEWEIPLENESLTDYAKRICSKIIHENPVLIGVSFGGILVQEMTKFVNVRKVIIISSVRSNTEFPRRMKITRALKAYKLLPTDVAGKIEKLARFCAMTATSVGPYATSFCGTGQQSMKMSFTFMEMRMKFFHSKTYQAALKLKAERTS